MLRWAAPGRQGYLLALATVAAALLRFETATGRMLPEAACWSALVAEPSGFKFLGDKAWPGWGLRSRRAAAGVR